MHLEEMWKINVFVGLLISAFVLTGCENDLKVPYFSTDIEYMGRVDVSGNFAKLMWPGTSAKITFEGSTVYAELQDETGDNYYNVIIDNDSIFMLHTDTGKHKYLLVQGLGKGKHTVELFKRTEWTKGTTRFYGFEITGDAGIFPPKKEKGLKLEFYGNSITAGYAVEDYSGKDSPDSIFTNNYYSYAAVAARKLNAEYYCIARSGIGIMISWFPMIMPEMYDRLDPSDPESKWDFSLYTPDIVVINLFQNDSWLVNNPDFPEFKHRFGTTPPDEKFIVESYKKFVTKIRSKYPAAKIICMLGSMDITKEGSPWPGYVTKAVEEMKDKNIYTLFVPYKNTPGHPKVEEQEAMADTLVGFIRKIESR
jgi:hypothetical protein